MKKSHIIAASIASVGIASIVGVGLVSAANTDGQSSLVDKLVAKFHLNKADVQQVFDQQKQENQADRAAKEKTRLDQAVKDGKITADQEAKIIAKNTEVEAFMATLKDKTPADRKAAMKTELDSLKQWATDNNIPQQFLRPALGGRGRGMKLQMPAN
jgi:polyhydroxyalkanoate synthesis regulator phasin